MFSKGVKTACVALALAVLGGFATQAKAISVTFANFVQTDPGATPWTFNNAGAASTFSLGGSTPVTFQSTTGLGQIISFNGLALATLSATVDGVAVTNPGDGSITQNFLAGADLKFVNAADPSQVVLDVIFTGNVTGSTSGTGALGASTSVSGQAIAYSSDFLLGSFVMPFTFSLTINSPLSVNTNGYLDSFATSATGTFSSNAVGAPGNPTPLPLAAYAGMSLLGSIGGLRVLSRRRRA